MPTRAAGLSRALIIAITTGTFSIITAAAAFADFSGGGSDRRIKRDIVPVSWGK
ncbi:hypothetical protein ACU635_59300 [[Actinomadura] parvosata]|uniref:hypothetical protein n=1 Tax=[Actinomadura] parvosata TaxID=1955412 RepID=UPI00406CEC35